MAKNYLVIKVHLGLTLKAVMRWSGLKEGYLESQWRLQVGEKTE